MKKFFIILFFLIFLSNISYGQQYTAEQIIENLYMEITVGKIYDITIDMEVFGRAGKGKDPKDEMVKLMTGTIFFLEPSNIRLEKTMVFQEIDGVNFAVVIRNGVKEWMYTNLAPVCYYKHEDSHVHSIYLPFNIDTQLYDSYRKYSKIGEEYAGAKCTYVIGISNSRDPIYKFITVWVDGERYVPMKEETFVRGQDGKENKHTTLYKEFKKLKDGRWMPFRIEKYVNDKLISYINFKDMIINQGLIPDMFNPEK